MIAVSASKLPTADLNNLMRALEIDVVAFTEILVPRGHRAEMGMIDAPAIHYNLKGSGRISRPALPFDVRSRGWYRTVDFCAALDDAVAAFKPTERRSGKTIIRVRP